MFTSWGELPDKMKNDKVKIYYDVLTKKRAALIIKRVFDIIASAIMIALFSWLFLVLAIAIKADSKGPVFFRQVRVTTGNREFGIFKFRTMVENAEKIGSLVTAENDVRVTGVGAKIRKCRLDEIPQLINVFKGEMTFVGTRPEVRKYVDKYTDEMMATLLMPAGITSMASINYKDEDMIINGLVKKGLNIDIAYTEHVLPEKMKYNLEYIKQFTFGEDIKLMIQTLKSVLKRGE